MAGAKRDRRRTDLAKFVDAYRELGAPGEDAARQAVWVILARHGSPEGATRAANTLWRHFLDPTELRVAKVTEIAYLVERQVKNDRIVVAEHVRGFLRRFVQEFQTLEFAATEGMSPDALKKFLLGLPDSGPEVALALALHYCHSEIELEAEQAAGESDPKAKRRADKEVTVAAQRLRMLFTVAAHGTATCRAKLVNCARCLLKAWTFTPLAVEGAADNPAQGGKGSGRGAGRARPRTSRTGRTRATTKKKSSRR